MLPTLADQIGELRGKVAEMKADLLAIRDFPPMLTPRVEALEQKDQNTRKTVEELRQKVETQAALMEPLQKPDLI